jgi:phosphate transport system substrate-binding protein
MKRTLMVLGVAGLMTAGVMAQSGRMISGAGATFPYPVYSKWAYEYKNQTGIGLNYQSIGSGGGIEQIKNKTVDFGASDAPRKPAELNERGQIQFPMVMGGVVPVANLQGIGPNQLRLSGDVLADIYLGKITRWNDPALTGLNKGVKLPDLEITVIHRADGSGTTWIFTNYLDKVSKTWHEKVGSDTSVDWPVGMGGKGNEGVASYVKQVPGALGYVEYAYAKQNKLTTLELKNKAGNFVQATTTAFQAAAANADWQHADHFYVVLTDQPGQESWPIAGATFIIIYKNQPKAEVAQTMLKYFDWCYRKGGKIAEELDYIPMPQTVVDLVEATWAKEAKSGGKPVWDASMAAK